jgi:hypothetical protein
MKEKIVTGKMTNMDTGETYEITPFHLFRGGFELNTFVKILDVKSFLHQDKSRQIYIDGLALDSCGSVFKVTMNFTPKCIDVEQKVLLDITVGKILAVQGEYGVLSDDEGGITLLEPTYFPLPQEYSIEEIEEVFRVNNMTDKNRLL